MSSDDGDRASLSRDRRRAAVMSAGALGLAFVGFQLLIGAEMAQGNACSLTPPGYLGQELVTRERHLFSYSCTLDPHNGKPTYTIHRPWQQVHGL